MISTTPSANATEARTCKKCDGTKRSKFFDAACHYCRGIGHFLPIDTDNILNLIAGRKGLCSKRPDDARAYYVWRMARFHGGVDVTMPMTAMSGVSGDAFLPELDKLADAVARRVFGTDMAAAHRWSGLLGAPLPRIEGLPATAYSCGPVVTTEKPECEILELR